MAKFFSQAQDEKAIARGYTEQDLAIAFEELRCPHCGGKMQFSNVVDPICTECTFFDQVKNVSTDTDNG